MSRSVQALQEPLQAVPASVEQGQGALNGAGGRLYVGDQIPALLDAQDLARLFECSVQTIYTWSKRGELRRFELRHPIGTKRWSGSLLKRFADGSLAGKA